MLTRNSRSFSCFYHRRAHTKTQTVQKMTHKLNYNTLTPAQNKPYYFYYYYYYYFRWKIINHHSDWIFFDLLILVAFCRNSLKSSFCRQPRPARIGDQSKEWSLGEIRTHPPLLPRRNLVVSIICVVSLKGIQSDKMVLKRKGKVNAFNDFKKEGFIARLIQ